MNYDTSIYPDIYKAQILYINNHNSTSETSNLNFKFWGLDSAASARPPATERSVHFLQHVVARCGRWIFEKRWRTFKSKTYIDRNK